MFRKILTPAQINHPQKQTCIVSSLWLDLIGALRRRYTIRFHPLRDGEHFS